jgi:micrococcal nuclease
MKPYLKKLPVVLLTVVCLLIAGCQADQATAPAESESTVQYVGSINSDKYHNPSCQWAGKIKPENEIWFSTKDDAEGAGYVPCKVCKP